MLISHHVPNLILPIYKSYIIKKNDSSRTTFVSTFSPRLYLEFASFLPIFEGGFHQSHHSSTIWLDLLLYLGADSQNEVTFSLVHWSIGPGSNTKSLIICVLLVACRPSMCVCANLPPWGLWVCQRFLGVVLTERERASKRRGRSGRLPLPIIFVHCRIG